MRRSLVVATVAVLAALGACSRSDDHRASSELKDAGHQVDHAASGLAHNQDVRNVEADFKHAGRDAAKDVRKLAAEAKVEAHKLAADTRGAAHDVTRDDHRDDKSS